MARSLRERKLRLMHTAASSPNHFAAGELVGRTELLVYLAGLLEPASRARVVLLHGAPGAGKTAVASALADVWEARGGVVERATLAHGQVVSGAGVAAAPRLLLVDAGPALLPRCDDAWLPLLRTMRAEDRLLVLARVAADLPVDDARVVEVRVEALGWGDAHALLARDGVSPERRASIARWAAGSPLHLVLAAQVCARDSGWDPAEGSVPADLAARLARRLQVTMPAGLAPQRFGHRAAIGGGSDVATDLAELRDAAEVAIRNYGRPDRLSSSPFATGMGEADRAASVRARVDGAVARTFSTSRADAELREVLTAGYLVASAPHERLALDLHLSRSTYFRRLSSALGRVAGQLAADARSGVAELGTAPVGTQVGASIGASRTLRLVAA